MICDTSGLITALTAGQQYHEECLAALNDADHLVLSPLTLCEVDYLMTSRQGSDASTRLLQRLNGPDYELAPFEPSDFALAIDVMKTYDDLQIGLVDASLVVLSKRYRTDEILTLDQQHFRAIRSLSGRPFKLLPFDAD